MNEYPLESVNQCEHFENLSPSLYLQLKCFLYSNRSNTDGLQRVLEQMGAADDCSKSTTKNQMNEKMDFGIIWRVFMKTEYILMMS